MEQQSNRKHTCCAFLYIKQFLFVSTKSSIGKINHAHPSFFFLHFPNSLHNPPVSTHHILFFNFSRNTFPCFYYCCCFFYLNFFELCCCVSVSRVHVGLSTNSLKGLRISIPFVMKLRKNAIFIESAAAESNAGDGSKSETKKEGDAISVEKQLMKQQKFCCC